MTLRPKLSGKLLSTPTKDVSDVLHLATLCHTFEVLSETVQKPSTGHGVMEANIGKQDALQQAYVGRECRTKDNARSDLRW